MSVSARVHYAAQALIELAIRRDDSSPVTTAEITERQGVPGPFLTQILRTLRTAGWVKSIRGANGGYRLAVDPETITLLDIAKLVGGCESGNVCCEHESNSGAKLRELWRDAESAYENVLASRTLDDLAQDVRCGDEAMWFI